MRTFESLLPKRFPVAKVPITAIVTAYQRVDETLLTMRRLTACDPSPAEILVHVDDNQARCADAVRSAFPYVRVLLSEGHIGPGGGRNKLLAASTFDVVASFDDDAYPVDGDYFARLETLFRCFPDASVICGALYHIGEHVEPDAKRAEWVADFSGGACAYRREYFHEVGGYVPLPVAYGMEEVDLSLRLHARGGRILRTSWLRVFHETDRARHADPLVTAASIANLVLLTYLRYPRSLWGIGAGQCLKRILWLMRQHRRRGILRGLTMVPSLLRQHRKYRCRLSRQAVRSYLYLRRHPIPVSWSLGDSAEATALPVLKT